MKFRTAYGKRVPCKLEFPEGEGLTKQSFRDECDINRIMNRYTKTQLVDHVNRFTGEYSDIGYVEFHDAMNLVIDAQEDFMALPAQVRAEFDNDPGRFLSFMADPDNAEKAVELGLATVPTPDLAQSIRALSDAVEASGDREKENEKSTDGS